MLVSPDFGGKHCLSDQKETITRTTELVAIFFERRNPLVGQATGDSLSKPIEMNDESMDLGQPSGIESDLLDPYERLISIEILGKTVDVPEKNRLLRCFQYLSLNTISYGDFCWNGECTNCQVWYHMEGQTADSDRPALACRIEVAEKMVVTRISHFIELEGISKTKNKG